MPSIAGTGKRYIVSRIEGIGANLAYASLNRSGGTTTLQDELTFSDLEAIRNTLPVAAVAGTYDLPIDFQIGGRPRHARLVGATRGFLKIRNLQITSGRYFDNEDFQSRSRVCLVTDAIAKRNPNLVLGDSLRIDQFHCTVIGTFTEGIPTFGQSEIQAETVLVPYRTARLVTGEAFLQVIYAQAESPAQVPAVTREIKRLLQSRHRREARYDVENLSALLATAGDISLAMTGVLLAVGLVTLTIGGTGIMNIMLANIAERKQEIGLRKALGARSYSTKIDNTIYVGATVEQAGFDKSNTAGGIAWLLSSAIQLVPELAYAAIVDIWSGLRPWSQDSYPILGKAPGWENVILATGHGPGGFELSAITGKTIADLITNGQTPALIQPFGLERFMRKGHTFDF